MIWDAFGVLVIVVAVVLAALGIAGNFAGKSPDDEEPK